LLPSFLWCHVAATIPIAPGGDALIPTDARPEAQFQRRPGFRVPTAEHGAER